MPDMTIYTIYDVDGDILHGPLLEREEANELYSLLTVDPDSQPCELIATHYKEVEAEVLLSTLVGEEKETF